MKRLTDSEFRDALCKGLGRAVWHVRDSQPEFIRDDLLKACLHFLGHDLQLEGGRSTWHYHMISLTGEKEFYRNEVLTALEAGSTDENHLDDTTSLIQLAAQFADQDDDNEAGEAVIRKYMTSCPEILDYDYWAPVIIDLEGLHGLGRVMNHWGYKLEKLARSWLPDPVEWAEEDYGPDEVAKYLDAVSESNKSIRLYWETVKAIRAAGESEDNSDKNETKNRLTFRELLDRFHIVYPESTVWTDETLRDFYRKNKKFRGVCRDAAQLQGPDDFAAAYEMLLHENDPCRQYLLLHCFHWPRHALPEVTPQLLGLLDAPFSLVRNKSARVFSLLSDPMIRAKGLEMLTDAAQRTDWSNALELLEQNFRVEDYPLLDAALHLPMDAKMSHDVACKIGYQLDSLEPEQCLRLLLWKYESGPCSECRLFCVEDLIERNLAPSWLLEECLDDCHNEMRELAQQYHNTMASASQNSE